MVNVVSLTTFSELFIPPLPEDVDLEVLIRRLKRIKAPTRQIITKNGRLWGYSRRTPSQLNCDRVFGYIGRCVTRLTKQLSDKTPTFSFQDDQDFEKCDTNTFPAAYFYTPKTDLSQTLDWSRVAVPGSYEMMIECGSFERVRVFPT